MRKLSSKSSSSVSRSPRAVARGVAKMFNNPLRSLGRVSSFRVPVKTHTINLKRVMQMDMLRKRHMDRFRQATPTIIRFNDVEVAKICKERRVRRQVLAARGKLGGAHKKPFFTLESYVRCK